MNKTKILKPIFNGQKSFYGKAKFIDNGNWKKKVLLSYNIEVVNIFGRCAIVLGDYSRTTKRHIKEFLLQNYFKAESNKQIKEDYFIK